MNVLISDDGVVKTYQREDGSTFIVPSNHVNGTVDPGTSIQDVRPEAMAVQPESLQDPLVPLSEPAISAPLSRTQEEMRPVAMTREPEQLPLTKAEPIPAPVEPVEEEEEDPIEIPKTQEDIQSMLSDSAQKRQEAARLQAEAEETDIKSKDILLNEEAERLKTERAEDIELETRKKEAVEAQQQKINNLQEQYDSTEIDSTAFWGTKSGGQKALSIVGMMMMEFSRPQSGIQMMNRLVDQNIDDQKTNLAKKGKSIDQAKGALSDILASYEDEAEGRIAAKKFASDLAANRLDKLANSTADAKRKAKLLDSASQFRQEAADQGMKLLQYADQRADADFSKKMQKSQNARGWAELKFRKDQAAQDRQDRLSAAAAEEANRKAMEESGQLSPEDRKVAVYAGGKVLRNANGELFRAATPDEGKDLRKKQAALDSLSQNVDRVLELKKKNGGSWGKLRSEEAALIKSAHTKIKLQVKELEKLGVLAGPDLDLIEEMVGKDPSQFWGKDLASLSEYRDGAVSSFDNDLRSNGYDGPMYTPPTPPAEKPKKSDFEASADKVIISAQKSRELRDSKTKFNNPKAQAKADAAMVEQIMKLDKKMWKDLDNSYGTDNSRLVAENTLAKLQRIREEATPAAYPRLDKMIGSVQEYIDTNGQSRKDALDAIKNKNKTEEEKRRKEEEKRRKIREESRRRVVDAPSSRYSGRKMR